MEKWDPIITRADTADGWSVTADYGKQGTSRAVIHIAPATPDERAANLRELNRVLGRFGYTTEGIT